MAIGNYYPVTRSVTDDDLFLGTRAGNNNTVNYLAQTVVDYLNTNAKISIGGQLSFKFTIVPNVPKTIAFSGGEGDNTAFSAITQLIVSAIDASDSNVTIFLEYLDGNEILLSQQNEPNMFGHYKITSYSVIGTSQFYTLNLEFIGGNGNIEKDAYYDINPFALSSSIGATPTLQQVTDQGNTTTNSIIFDNGSSNAIGISNSEIQLSSLNVNGSFSTLFGISLIDDITTEQFRLNLDGLLLKTASGGNGGIIKADLLTSTLKTYQLPDASGTIALTSDIPSLTGYVQTTRTLTINGTTYDLSANRTWSVGDLLSSGSYADPSWITSLAYSKLTGAPTIPTVGTWGELNYPTWTSGTPFVKMTAAGTFALDTNTYLTSAVTSVSASGLLTSTGGNTPTISTSIATNKLVGRTTAGTGTMEEITVGSGLTLSAGTLSATASGSYVPYTGATGNVDLGTHTLLARDLVINHSSGSGVAASITKGGSGEALTVVKTSGSGNAASITGGTTLISELNLTTDLADAYIASAATWNAKFTLPSLSSGSVIFSNGTTLAQDNANFFWDDTNNRLGIGTTSPSGKLHVNGSMYLQNATTGIESIFFSSGPLINNDGPGGIFRSGEVYTDTINGRVGIVTSTPTTALDVNGVITATGGNSTSWNAKQDAITLTTTGTSGPATLVGATLNIPEYAGGSATPIDIQLFTSSGVWTKPAGATVVEIYLVSGGAGGGSGRRGATLTARYGGGGGSSGAINAVKLQASALGTTENVWIGAGGNGGAAITVNDTNGSNGSAGTASFFGGTGSLGTSLVSTNVSIVGNGGTAVSQGGASYNSSYYFNSILAASSYSSTNNNPNNLAPAALSLPMRALASGGMGGGLSTTNVTSGGQIVNITAPNTAKVLYSTAAGANGVLYTSTSVGNLFTSTGGGGGRAGTDDGVTAAVAGGNGGPGAGGAGGGASANGFNSGAGGRGGDGFCMIVTYF